MHIGIDASRVAEDSRTGTENYTFNLIEALKKIDKVNKYTLYFNKLPQYFEINQQNVSTRLIPMKRLWTQARLAVECLFNPPDILFVPAHTLPIIRLPKVRTVVTIHDLGAEFLAEYHQFPQKLYLNWSTKYAARNADQLIAVSKSTQRDLIARLGAKKEKISVIYEGVDQDFFQKNSHEETSAIKAKYGLNKPYLLFVGTIQPRKNLELLIEAFARVKNTDLELVIAGKPGWLYETIYLSPEKNKVKDKVKFLGFIPTDDLPPVYSGALAFVYPSLYEGFGLPLLEAMACSCPIIASNSSSIPEVVGDAALLFDPNNKDQIVKSIRTIIKDSDLRADLAQKANRQVKKFTWEKAAEETLKVFEKVYAKNT